MNSLKKNHPTCEKSKDLSCTINDEVINTFIDIMWNVWKKFWSKKDEKSIYAPLQKETENHEVEIELPQVDCRKEHKEESEYKHTILTNGGCENKREFIDGSLNYERVPTDGCSQLYAVDIEIIFETFVASQILMSINMKIL